MDPTRRTYESPRGVAPYETRELRPGEERIITTYLRGKRVLDLGCGSGRTTAHIAKVAQEVIGVDYAAAMVARAKGLHPALDFRIMDARSLDFADASFDAIFFSFNGLDYIYPLQDRVRALKEIRRALATGGVLAYSSHTNTPGLRMSPRILLGWLYGLLFGYRPPYFARMTPGGILVTCHLSEAVQRGMLEEAGFRVVEVTPAKKGEAFFVAQKV